MIMLKWLVYSYVLVLARSSLFAFFFFQAEDGIRDGRVTGVQTCALPILGARDLSNPDMASYYAEAGAWQSGSLTALGRNEEARRGAHEDIALAEKVLELRSEERRVGKECRARWSPGQYGKKVGVGGAGEV